MIEPETKPLLQIRDLNVTYRGMLADVHAVRGVSMDVTAGEAVAVVGESGSGKTTVAMALMGLLPKGRASVTGQVEFGGRNILENSIRQWQDLRGNEIAMIFQDPMTSLNPYLTIGTQVGEPVWRHGEGGWKAADQRAVELLADMEIPDPEGAAKKYPHQYSGGMRQRAMIGTAFAAAPKILIADEPTTALDVITQARVLRLMRRRLRERGMALILITHDLGIVAGVCDRVVVMKDGLVVEQGAAEEIYARPQHEYTRQLLAAVPRVDGNVNPFTTQHANRGAYPDPTCQSGCIPRPNTPITISRASVHFTTTKGFFSKTRSTVRAVDDVDLGVMRGEVLGVVGQSGSGKSTLLRSIVGLQPLTSGSIEVLGNVVDARNRKSLRAIRSKVQVVFQDPLASLNGRFTAERIIAEPLINFKGVDRKTAQKRARELMDLVNLDPNWANRFPHEFSGGQCQRIGIARALAVEPEILLCDEPVSALDVSIQADVLKLLADLRRRFDLTVLFITHDLAVVRHVADRVAVMHKGKIVELGPAAQICQSPQHDYSKQLLAAVPIPAPTSDWLER